MERGRRLTGGNQAKVLVVGFILFLVVCSIAWWNSAQEMPVISVPTPVMPRPNAFDTFNSVIAKFIDSNKVGFAISAKHAGTSKDDREYTWAEKEKFVSENAPALALLRQGLNEEYRNPPARSFSVLFPYYAKHRAMARLLLLESQVRAHRGDYAGAVRSSLDAIELGELVPHGSTLIGSLVGIACQSIGRRPVWQYADRLNADDARAAVRRLEQIRAKQCPVSDTFQEEKWALQAGLLEMLRTPNSINTLAQNIGAPVPSFAESPAISQLAFLIYPKRRIMADVTRYMDSEIAYAKLPYGSAPPPAVPKDPWVEMVAPVYDPVILKFVESDTQNRLVEVALALRAYRLDHHGANPATIDALVPADLPHVPADPFGRGAPLHYRRSGTGYVLYSVGPDGKDDGGVPIDTGLDPKATNPSERYYVKAESKGDVVAGKNIW